MVGLRIEFYGIADLLLIAMRLLARINADQMIIIFRLDKN